MDLGRGSGGRSTGRAAGFPGGSLPAGTPRSERGAGAAHVELDDAPDAACTEARHLLELDSALSRLEVENPAWVRVVECRIFAGMTEQETADADKEQQAEKQAEQQADGAQKSGASA